MSPQFLQGFPSSRHLSLLVLCMTDTKEARLQLVLMHAHTCVHAVSPFSVSLSGDKTGKSFRLPPRSCTVRPRSLVDRGTEAPSLHGTSTRGHSHITAIHGQVTGASDKEGEQMALPSHASLRLQHRGNPVPLHVLHKPRNFQPSPRHTSAWPS